MTSKMAQAYPAIMDATEGMSTDELLNLAYIAAAEIARLVEDIDINTLVLYKEATEDA